MHRNIKSKSVGKGSECIKTLRMRGSVPVHRNLKCINAWRWRGNCPRTSKLSLPSCKTWRGREKGPSAEGPSASKYKVKIGCKDMEGREKGPSTERIKVHRNLKSKSAESRSIVKIG